MLQPSANLNRPVERLTDPTGLAALSNGVALLEPLAAVPAVAHGRFSIYGLYQGLEWRDTHMRNEPWLASGERKTGMLNSRLTVEMVATLSWSARVDQSWSSRVIERCFDSCTPDGSVMT